jgi:hypothetical protein
MLHTQGPQEPIARPQRQKMENSQKEAQSVQKKPKSQSMKTAIIAAHTIKRSSKNQ